MMLARSGRVMFALMSFATHEATAAPPAYIFTQAHNSAQTIDPADPSHRLSFRQARPRPLATHRLRGGASSVKQSGGEPALKPKFAAYVVACAVLPTLLRLAFAAATMPPPPLELAGWWATDVRCLSGACPSVPGVPVLPFPKRWQLALAAAWVANNLAVVVPGRYDGRSEMAAEKPTAETANLFTPAGWAFAIWGPIFLGEWLMMLYLTNVPAAAALGAAAAPGWCAATAAQVAWCAAFRPSVCGPSTLWVPAALLAATGVGLGASHRAIRNVGHAGVANAFVRWPVALHFGWITAASLVNLNNWLARRAAPLHLREAASLGSVAAAVAAAAYVTFSTSDPIFAAVVAWALAAVAADGSRAARGLVADATLDRLRKAARAGCGLAVLLACTQI